MRSITFTAAIADHGPTGAWCHLFFPAEASTFLGKRGQVPIVLRVNGAELRSTARPDGKGGHFILFNIEMREKSGAGAGDAVSVELRIDTASREVKVPADVQRALKSAKAAKAAFEAMPPSHRKAYIEFIDEANRADTRAKRVAQSLKMMEDWGAKRRFNPLPVRRSGPLPGDSPEPSAARRPHRRSAASSATPSSRPRRRDRAGISRTAR